MIIDVHCRIFVIDPDSGWLDFAKSALTSITKETGMQICSATHIEKILSLTKIPISIPRIVFVDLEFAEKEPDLLGRIANTKNWYVVILFPTGFLPYRISAIFKLGVYDCIEKPYDIQSLSNIFENLKDEINFSRQSTSASLNPIVFSSC